MNKQKLSMLDIEELAAVVCGLDPNKTDTDEIETALYEKFEISTEAFESLINKLFSMLEFNVSPLTYKPYIGFANDEIWLLKKEVTTRKFISNLIQWITKGEDLGKGFVKPITLNGIVEFNLCMIKSEYEIKISKSEK
jgi:hypothetical protein